jgi:hypothetical protein
MEPSDLPPELAEVEQLLAARARPAPSADHKARVLATVRREVAAQQTWWHRPDAWRYAAGVAAALVLGMNLALFASTGTSRLPICNGHATEIDQAAAEIQKLVPDLGPAEARRQALVMAGASSLVLLPRPSGEETIQNMINNHKEVPSWVTP